MYRCTNCGFEFEYPLEWKEERGEFWGDKCFETVSGCPECRRGYDTIEKCAVCGEYHFEDDLLNDICEDCRESKVTYELALKFLKHKGWLADFFLCYYYQIAKINNFERSEALDEEFCKIYEFKCREDIECCKHNFFDDVKHYVLDEICEWTEFLRKEAIENENTKG